MLPSSAVVFLRSFKLLTSHCLKLLKDELPGDPKYTDAYSPLSLEVKDLRLLSGVTYAGDRI